MDRVYHLVAAVVAADDARVRELLAQEPALLQTRTMFGVNAAHAAALAGRLDVLGEVDIDPYLAAEIGDIARVRAALASDATFATAFNSIGSTALHGAAYFGQVATVRVLLEAGADADAVTRDEFLQIPVLGSAIATTPGVPQPSDDEDVVLELVRLLLEGGADVNRVRRDGMTALHAAAWRGLARVVQELLDAGADPAVTAVDGPHTGQTAADTACSQGHLLLAVALDTGAPTANPYG